LQYRFSYSRQFISFTVTVNKCIKFFFGFSRRFSLTQVFLETGLPSFDTVVHTWCIYIDLSVCQSVFLHFMFLYIYLSGE